jgi:hypothetical protein
VRILVSVLHSQKNPVSPMKKAISNVTFLILNGLFDTHRTYLLEICQALQHFGHAIHF